jgi:ribosomal protein S18 acetylase RimI-like enzyme
MAVTDHHDHDIPGVIKAARQAGRLKPRAGTPAQHAPPNELNRQAGDGQTPPVDVIDATGRAPRIDEAAQIWAEATAARDGHDQVPALDVSRPVIQDALDHSSRAFLLIARSTDGTAAGFAAIEPAPGSNETIAQVSYIGVRPRLWGQGIGETLLLEACRRLIAAGYASVELSVYADNQKAAALYQRLGWQAVGLPSAHPKTGKPEQRYELRLKPA